MPPGVDAGPERGRGPAARVQPDQAAPARYNVRYRDDNRTPGWPCPWPTRSPGRGSSAGQAQGDQVLRPLRPRLRDPGDPGSPLRTFPMRTCSKGCSTGTGAWAGPASCSTSTSARGRAWATSPRGAPARSSRTSWPSWTAAPGRPCSGWRPRCARPPSSSTSSWRPGCATSWAASARPWSASRWCPPAPRTSTSPPSPRTTWRRPSRCSSSAGAGWWAGAGSWSTRSRPSTPPPWPPPSSSSYGDRADEIPREVFLPVQPEGADGLRAWLAGLRGGPVDFRVPRRGRSGPCWRRWRPTPARPSPPTS